MKRLKVKHLEEVRQDFHELAPGYYLPQTDAIEAVETGVGNCFAKAMMACGIVAVRYGLEPSVVYSDRLHGTDRPSKKPLDPRTNKNMAHIEMVVPGEKGKIPALRFGVNVVKGVYQVMSAEEEGDILEDYNAEDQRFLQVKSTGEIAPTEYGLEVGLVAGNWQVLGNRYLSKIDRPALDIDRLISALVEKGIHAPEAA